MFSFLAVALGEGSLAGIKKKGDVPELPITVRVKVSIEGRLE